MNLTDTPEIFEFLKGIVKIGGVDPSKVFTAGGSMRDISDINDFDIYCEDGVTIEKLAELFRSFGAKEICHTDKAITLKFAQIEPEVQIIKMVSGKAEDVVKTFDFTLNANYLYFSEEKFKYPEYVGELIPQDNPMTPNTMLYRLLKLSAKGKGIKKENLVKVLRMVEKSFDKTPDDGYINFKDLADNSGGNL